MRYNSKIYKTVLYSLLLTVIVSTSILFVVILKNRFYKPTITSSELFTNTLISNKDKVSDEYIDTAKIEKISTKECDSHNDCAAAEITTNSKNGLKRSSVILNDTQQQKYNDGDQIVVREEQDNQIYTIISYNKLNIIYILIVITVLIFLLINGIDGLVAMIKVGLILAALYFLFNATTISPGNFAIFGLFFVFLIFTIQQIDIIIKKNKQSLLVSLISGYTTLLIITPIIFLVRNLLNIDNPSNYNMDTLLTLSEFNIIEYISASDMFIIILLTILTLFITKITNIIVKLNAENKKQNPNQTFLHLNITTIKKARKHIISNIGSLLLITASVNIPILFVLFSLVKDDVSAQYILNTSMVLEIVLYITISTISIILATIISTLVSSLYHSSKYKAESVLIKKIKV